MKLHPPLVIVYAQKQKTGGKDWLTFEQRAFAGAEGLQNVVEKLDPVHGFSLSKYAVW